MRKGFGGTILHPMRFLTGLIRYGAGRQKLGFEKTPRSGIHLQMGRISQEVLFGCIFIQTAYQVGDGIDKLVRLATGA